VPPVPAWFIYKTGPDRHETDDGGQNCGQCNGDYEKYQALDRQIKEARAAFDASAKNMFTKRGEGADEVDILMFELFRNGM